MIIAIEGPSYAGKTSLVRNLASFLGDRVEIVPEYNEIAGGAINFPPPPMNKEEAIKATIFFLELEKQRQALLLDTITTGQVVIQDRSLYSCLAFDYASAAVGEFDIWLQSQKMFLDNGLLLPGAVLFLDVSQANILERKERDTYQIPDKLVDPRFNKAFKRYFASVVCRVSPVYWIDANMDSDKVCQSALQLFDHIE